jgi:hypothetical protein
MTRVILCGSTLEGILTRLLLLSLASPSGFGHPLFQKLLRSLFSFPFEFGVWENNEGKDWKSCSLLQQIRIVLLLVKEQALQPNLVE